MRQVVIDSEQVAFLPESKGIRIKSEMTYSEFHTRTAS